MVCGSVKLNTGRCDVSGGAGLGNGVNAVISTE